MAPQISVQKAREGHNIASHWLRGGQTLGHTWDMVIDVLKKFGIPAALVWWFIWNKVNDKATLTERIYGMQSLVVWIYKSIGKPFPKKITVTDDFHVSHVYTITQFDNTDWIQAAVHQYQIYLWIGFAIWLLVCLSIGSIASVFFIRAGEKKLEDIEIRGQRICSVRHLVGVVTRYNATQLRNTNINTLNSLGIKNRSAFERGGLRLSIAFGLNCASMFVRDCSVLAFETLTYPFSFFDNCQLSMRNALPLEHGLPASTPGQIASIQTVGSDALLAEQQKPTLTQKLIAAARRTSHDFERSALKRSHSDFYLRAYIASIPADRRNAPAIIDDNPRAIHKIINSASWGVDQDTRAQDVLMRCVSVLAQTSELPFISEPLTYVHPSIIGLNYPVESEREHTLVVGGTGSGKTVAIHTMIDTIKARGDKAFIYDPDGDYIKYHYREGIDRIINPFDKRTVHWSPFNDTFSLTDWQSAAEDLFTDSSSEPYWTLVPREIYSRVGYHMSLWWRDKKDRKPTVYEFLQVLNGNHNLLYRLIEGTAAARALGENPGSRSDSLRSVIAQISSRLEHLQPVDAQFSVKHWINDPDEHGLLFVNSPDDISASLAPLLSHWAALATNAILSRDLELRNQPTWLILDEFGKLDIPILAEASARLRKFNGRMVLGLQQRSQLVKRYGEELADEIIGQMSNILILKLNDNVTAEYFSKLIGEREIRRKDESTSYGASNIRDGVSITPKDSMERIALPEELKNLPKFHGWLKFSPGRDKLPFPFAPVRYQPIDRPALNRHLERIENTETINQIHPSITRQMQIQELLEESLPASPAQQKQAAAATKVVVDLMTGEVVEDAAPVSKRGDDYEKSPQNGDTPDSLPANEKTLQTPHEGIRGLDKNIPILTDQEMANAGDARMAEHLEREAVIKSSDSITAVFARVSATVDDIAVKPTIGFQSAAMQQQSREYNIVPDEKGPGHTPHLDHQAKAQQQPAQSAPTELERRNSVPLRMPGDDMEIGQ